MEENAEEKGLAIIVEPAKVPALFKAKGCDPIIDKIKQLVADFVPDLSTKKGRDEIASLGWKVARSKTYVDGLGKDLGSGYKVKLSTIDAERKRFRDSLDGIKSEHMAPLVEWKRLEEVRIVTIMAKIEGLCLMVPENPSSFDYELAIANLEAHEITPEEYMEFAERANSVKAEVLAAATRAKEAREEREAEQRRQVEEAERLDTERKIYKKINDDLRAWISPADTVDGLREMLTRFNALVISDAEYGALVSDAIKTAAGSIQAIKDAIQVREDQAAIRKERAEAEAAEEERKRIADEDAAAAQKKIDDANAAHALKVKAEEDRLQEVEDSRQRALADERAVLDAEKERLRLVQQAIDDKEAAEMKEAAKIAREAAEKLKVEAEAKEAAERAERLKPDMDKIVRVINSIEKLNTELPVVVDALAVSIVAEISVRLGAIQDYIEASII